MITRRNFLKLSGGLVGTTLLRPARSVEANGVSVVEVTIDGIKWPGIKSDFGGVTWAIRPDLIVQNGMICARVPDPIWETIEIVSDCDINFILVGKDTDGLFHVKVVHGGRTYIDNDMKLLYYGADYDNYGNKEMRRRGSRAIFGAYFPKPP